MARDFRELKVWEESMVLAECVYALVRQFPADERFGLAAQMKRAAVSVPSCIAEGNARASTRDYLRFLSMAAGSFAEVQTQALLSQRLGFSEAALVERCLGQHGKVSKLLQALRNSLLRRIGADEADSHSPFPVPRSRTT